VRPPRCGGPPPSPRASALLRLALRGGPRRVASLTATPPRPLGLAGMGFAPPRLLKQAPPFGGFATDADGVLRRPPQHARRLQRRRWGAEGPLQPPTLTGSALSTFAPGPRPSSQERVSRRWDESVNLMLSVRLSLFCGRPVKDLRFATTFLLRQKGKAVENGHKKQERGRFPQPCP
jgi:hypothetical protein